MKIVKINPYKITDWNSFHDEFSKAFNFPNYYGRNMDAWIDCMDKFIEEITLIDLGNCQQLQKNNPEIIQAINECSAFVNYRRIESNRKPTILISMFT